MHRDTPENTGSGKGKRTAGFRQIAVCAGVSVTTVERVLNERGSVSSITRTKVIRAAQLLGIRRVLPNLDIGNPTIEAILPVNPTLYWAKLARALRETAKLLPRGITVHRTFIRENSPKAMMNAILKSTTKRTALLVAADVSPAVEASLGQVIGRGEIVVLLSSRINTLPTHAFSGIDNVAAGRTAATLINFGMRGAGGLVFVLQGSAALQSHRDRVEGLRQKLDPSCDVLVEVTHEIPGASHRLLCSLLSTGRTPAAIYETGDPGDEIAPILRGMGKRPIWIGHEHNQAHDQLMREGLLDFVLDQDPIEQARWALGHIMEELGIFVPALNSSRRPELRIFCSSNSVEPARTTLSDP